MSTIEEFESAPVGATATHPDGRRATKTSRVTYPWDMTGECRSTSSYMVSAGYTLDPSIPTTAREALDLAWELAHPVKEGQVIPAGTDYLLSRNGERPATMRANLDQFASKVDETNRRTLDPLPDPEPDWLDAPAVIAVVKGRVGDPQVFARENKTGTQWLCDTKVYRWDELIAVVPLYPKETDA